MGREIRRVSLTYDFKIGEIWPGFINHLYDASSDCPHCAGSGYSAEAKRLSDQWYGKQPFRPEMTGSTPLTVETPAVRAFAERNVTRSPEYYGKGEAAIVWEAKRLIEMWNAQWCHHLSADDVAALVEANRLHDLTHTWTSKTGWKRKEPFVMPTPQQVNEWSIGGFGHDSINQWVCVKAACKRLGADDTCRRCDGEGRLWPSPEAKAAYEAWEDTPPPEGDGYQLWSTTTEGTPMTPVFATPEDLARYCADEKVSSFGDETLPYAKWLAFIRGPGWAPSGVSVGGGPIQSGVAAAAG